MVATDVYKIAIALPPEELAKLSDMLKSHILPKAQKKQNKQKAPVFTDDDALEYLLNHFNNKR